MSLTAPPKIPANNILGNVRAVISTIIDTLLLTGELTEDGLLQLLTGPGDSIDIDLASVFLKRSEVNGLTVVPPASENQSGRLAIVSDQEAILGEDDTKAMTAAKTLLLLLSMGVPKFNLADTEAGELLMIDAKSDDGIVIGSKTRLEIINSLTAPEVLALCAKLTAAGCGGGTTPEEFTYEIDQIFKEELEAVPVTPVSQRIITVTAMNEGTVNTAVVEVTYSDNSKRFETDTVERSSTDFSLQWDADGTLRCLADTVSGNTRTATLRSKKAGLIDAVAELTLYDTTAVNPNGQYRIVQVGDAVPAEGGVDIQYKAQYQTTDLAWHDMTDPHSFRFVGAPFGISVSTGGLAHFGPGTIDRDTIIPLQLLADVSADFSFTQEAEAATGNGLIYDKSGASNGKIKAGNLSFPVVNVPANANYTFGMYYQTNISSSQVNEADESTIPYALISVNGATPIKQRITATGGVLTSSPTNVTIPLVAGNGNQVSITFTHYTASDKFVISGTGSSNQVLAALDVTVINVNTQVNRPPVLNTPLGLKTAPQGEVTEIDLLFSSRFSDPDGDSLTFGVQYYTGTDWSNTLPSWASVANGKLTVEPPITGPNLDYAFRGTAFDGQETTTDAFTLRALVIPTVTVGDWSNRYLFPNDRTQSQLAADGFSVADGAFAATGGLLKQTSTVPNSAVATATLIAASGIDDPINSTSMLVRFRVTEFAGHFVGVVLKAPDVAHGVGIAMSSQAGFGLANINVGNLANGDYPWQLNRWYYIRLNYTETGTTTATVSGKLWRESQIEPASWQAVATNVPRLSGNPMLFMGGNNGSGTTKMDVSVIYTHKTV